jgi:hypothetical protein
MDDSSEWDSFTKDDALGILDNDAAGRSNVSRPTVRSWKNSGSVDSQGLLEVREAVDAAVLLLPRDDDEASGVSSGCPQLAGNFNSHLL